MRCHHILGHLYIWSPVGDTVWVAVGGLALLGGNMSASVGFEHPKPCACFYCALCFLLVFQDVAATLAVNPTAMESEAPNKPFFL